MARLGKRERAIERAKQARIDRVDYAYTVETSTMRARYWENYSGKVCQNIKGTSPKFKASNCLWDKCQSIKG
jgi:hypothetical protein